MPIVIEVLLLVEFVFVMTIGADRFAVDIPPRTVPPMTAGNLKEFAPVAALQSKIPFAVVANVCVE